MVSNRFVRPLLVFVPVACFLFSLFARLLTLELPAPAPFMRVSSTSTTTTAVVAVYDDRIKVQAADEAEAALVGDERETEVIPSSFR